MREALFRYSGEISFASRFDWPSSILFADFTTVDKDLRNRISSHRRDELPQLPSSDDKSTDPDVVEMRKAWIEEYLQLSFQFLDEAMSSRQTHQSDNSWETFTFAKNWCVLSRVDTVVSALTWRADLYA